MLLFHTFLLFAVTIHTVPLGDANQESVTRLKKMLFSNYSTNIRPVKDVSKTIDVSTKMWIFHVEDVNDTRQIIKFHGVVQMFWKDDFLNWSPSDYNGTLYFMANNLAVWTPKLILLNSAAPNTFSYLWNLPIKVWNTGSMYATVELTVTSTCAFDFTDYPYDTQRCPVAFYMGATLDQVQFFNIFDPELRFYWRQGGADSEGNKRTASNWEIVDEPTAYRRFYTAAGLNDTLGDTPKNAATMILELWISFRRRLSFFRVAIVLPAVLTSILTVAAMMPMETTSALGLLVLNLLIQATFVDNLFMVVPKSIGIVPRIVRYYAINMTLTVTAIVARLLVQWSLNRELKALEHKPPAEQQDTDIIERVEKKSCLDQFFNIATPTRLTRICLVAYFLIYAVCGGLLLC